MPVQYAEVTVSQTVRPSELLQIVTAMLEADQPLMVWGPPGIGKTDIGNQAGEALNFILHDIRPAQYERIDLLGVPYVDADKRTVYAVPDFLPRENSPERHLLILDELPNAKSDMQTALYQLVLDRRCNNYRLPPGARLMACGNRRKDAGGAYRMAAPLASRFIHVELETSPEDWLDWAVNHNLDPDILFFIHFSPEHLHDFDPRREDPAYACPRSWANLSKVMPQIQDFPDNLKSAVYRGAVGESAATAFAGFQAMKQDLPHPREVLLNPQQAKVPANGSARAALAGSLCRLAQPDNMDALCTYAGRLGPELGTYLVGQTVRMKPELRQTHGYTKWAAGQP